MRVNARNEDWLAVVGVSGELDAASAPELRAELHQCIDGGARWLLVNLEGLEYIDSVGLGLLIGAARRVSELGGELAVASQRPNLRRVFEISGTRDLLNVSQDEAQARALLEEHYRRFEESAVPQEGEDNA